MPAPLLAALLGALQVSAPLPGPDPLTHRNGRIPPAATAVRTAEPIRIDGRLDEPRWAAAPPATGFRRDVPSDGRPAAEESEIRVLYDDHALYIGARLFHRNRSGVSRRLSRRDSFSVFNDVFFVMLDSYHDHSTAFIFGVTPAGERRDGLQSSDGASLDASWDPVWEARTTVDSLGWVAEMRIPFSQVRFPDGAEQTWGVQFRRDIRAAGEAVDWSWSPRTEPGTTSKYGHLLGLSRIPRPSRLEVLPWSLARTRLTENAPRTNPFDDGSVAGAAAGLDLKYGVTSDLTLDATINPDFGQVEADPAVVNLTAFETFFEERRPFFVERSDLFRFGVDANANLFYSRRVGRAPSLTARGSAAFVDEPPATTILGAARLTGRTRGGWSLGIMEAVTGEEAARRAGPTGERLENAPIEPLSNYLVARVRREYAGGSSYVGAMATGVNRRLDEDGFAGLRAAGYTAGLDFVHRFRLNAYVLSGYLAGSHVRGSELALARTQLSSARYFQRPDQDYLSLDSTRTSLTGTMGQLRFQKPSGEVVYSATAGFIAPGFEANDVGFQTDADRVLFRGTLGRRWLTPGRVFRTLSTEAHLIQRFNFGGLNVARQGLVNLSGQFHNLWSASLQLNRNLESGDDRVTRGGPVRTRPANWAVAGGFSSDSRKAVAIRFTGSYAWNAVGSWALDGTTDVTFRPQGAFDLTASVAMTRSREDAFYVTQAADAAAEATFGRRYLFGRLDQHVLNTTLRANWLLTPQLSVQLYAQPFLATGDYRGFRALAQPGSYRFLEYGRDGSTIGFDPDDGTYTADADGVGPAVPITFLNPDFRVRSLRSNLVVRWEYRPGSTLFVVWNQTRGSQISDPRFRGFRDLWDLRLDDMQNVFLVKLNWYLNL